MASRNTNLQHDKLYLPDRYQACKIVYPFCCRSQVILPYFDLLRFRKISLNQAAVTAVPIAEEPIAERLRQCTVEEDSICFRSASNEPTTYFSRD